MESLPENVLVDVVTLIFVLSAVHPEKMQKAVENIAKVRNILIVPKKRNSIVEFHWNIFEKMESVNTKLQLQRSCDLSAAPASVGTGPASTQGH